MDIEPIDQEVILTLNSHLSEEVIEALMGARPELATIIKAQENKKYKELLEQLLNIKINADIYGPQTNFKKKYFLFREDQILQNADFEDVKFLLKLNLTDNQYKLLLTETLKKGTDLKALSLLLSYQKAMIDPDIFIAASCGGNSEMFLSLSNLIKKNYPGVTIASSLYSRCLLEALKCKKDSMVNFLLKETYDDKNLDLKDSILLAANLKYINLLKILLKDYRANVLDDNLGDKILFIAVKNADIDTIKFLIKDGRNSPNKNKGELLEYAVMLGNLKAVAALLKDPRINVHENNDNALKIALGSAKYNILAILANKAAGVDEKQTDEDQADGDEDQTDGDEDQTDEDED
jgi:hypothetical protein